MRFRGAKITEIPRCALNDVIFAPKNDESRHCEEDGSPTKQSRKIDAIQTGLLRSFLPRNDRNLFTSIITF
ncbi:hypothetical protein IJ541_04830 [bacterium]|nr:hypothetical protein [bacterium]